MQTLQVKIFQSLRSSFYLFLFFTELHIFNAVFESYFAKNISFYIKMFKNNTNECINTRKNIFYLKPIFHVNTLIPFCKKFYFILVLCRIKRCIRLYIKIEQFYSKQLKNRYFRSRCIHQVTIRRLIFPNKIFFCHPLF